MTGAVTGSVVLAALAAVAAGAALLELARAPVGRRRRRPAGGPPLARRWTSVAGPSPQVEALLDGAGRVHVRDAAGLEGRRRLGAAVGAAWGGALAIVVLPGPAALAVALAGGAGGHALPMILLRRAAQAREARLRDEAPELLELLAVALSCGLPIRAALSESSAWTAGELSRGVERAAAELARGAGTPPTMARLVREHRAAELEAAVAIIERSRTHGTPAAPPLRALAASARHARARRAMEHAARAAPRVQLVAALLLVPAALCVLAAALVAGGLG